jgi:hypothetical protein
MWTASAASGSDFESADPLGLRQLEQQVADWFWPGFSERTTTAGYYPMVAYGLWLAEEAARRTGLQLNDDNARASFQRWERLWAMAVCVYHRGRIPAEDRMRGAAGAERALGLAGRSKLPIAYPLTARGRELGALGAYLASLRAFGFVAPDRLRVTPLGWKLASWMWGAPDDDDADCHALVLAALDPRTTLIPQRHGSVSLAALGERGRPSQLRVRSGVRTLLWERLFAGKSHGGSPTLHELAQARLDGKAPPGETETFLEHMQRGTSGVRVGTDLRAAATMASALIELGRPLCDIFARTCDVVRNGGYTSTWSECVQQAVTAESVDALGRALARWKQLGMEQRIGALPGCGRVLAFVMKRLNTQNMYNVFESVLALHTLSQQTLSQGNGWLVRQGEAVYLRSRGVDVPEDELQWRPTFRFAALDLLLSELVTAS